MGGEKGAEGDAGGCLVGQVEKKKVENGKFFQEEKRFTRK